MIEFSSIRCWWQFLGCTRFSSQEHKRSATCCSTAPHALCNGTDLDSLSSLFAVVLKASAGENQRQVSGPAELMGWREAAEALRVRERARSTAQLTRLPGGHRALGATAGGGGHRSTAGPAPLAVSAAPSDRLKLTRLGRILEPDNVRAGRKLRNNLAPPLTLQMMKLRCKGVQGTC